MFPCREPGCDQLSEPFGEQVPFKATGPGGSWVRVWYEWRRCVVGHRYLVEVFEEEA